MSDVVERFMRYVQVASTSDPANEEQTPSTPAQIDMAALLGEELAALGCADVKVGEHAYVTATVPASAGAEAAPALMLCAHIDSSPDAPGKGVNPRIVRYEGGDLVHGEGVVTRPSDEPGLEKLVGADLIVTDGTTLLSADDKAGVAEIVSLVSRIVDNPALPHPELKIAFVPDEEIGHGASLLDLDALGAAYGYTVDGGPIGEYSYECFSACQATVVFHGTVVHPGTAKDIMVNALTLAAKFQEAVPALERPEHTEGREGFYHPTSIEGTPDEVTLSYIIRDFDAASFDERQRTLERIADEMNGEYGAGRVEVAFKQQYRNMAEHLSGAEFLNDCALAAFRAAGYEPFVEPVRGGTDGAQLTFRGLPCPNLSTGGFAYHSVREFIPVASLEGMVDVLEKLVCLLAERRA